MGYYKAGNCVAITGTSGSVCENCQKLAKAARYDKLVAALKDKSLASFLAKEGGMATYYGASWEFNLQAINAYRQHLLAKVGEKQ